MKCFLVKIPSYSWFVDISGWLETHVAQLRWTTWTEWAQARPIARPGFESVCLEWCGDTVSTSFIICVPVLLLFRNPEGSHSERLMHVFICREFRCTLVHSRKQIRLYALDCCNHFTPIYNTTLLSVGLFYDRFLLPSFLVVTSLVRLQMTNTRFGESKHHLLFSFENSV